MEQSHISNSSCTWLGCFRVSKDTEGACTPPVTIIPYSLAGTTLHSWVQVPGGDLNMQADLLSVSGRMKPDVSV